MMTRRLWITCATLPLLATGCASLLPKAAPPPLRYTLAVPDAGVTAESSGKSLAVRSLEPARPYKQNVVTRSGDELAQYTSVEWAELPADTVTRALMDALVASGRFNDVAQAVDLTRPDWILTGQLRRFDLVRDTEPWTAVCEARLELREASGRALIWAKTIRAEEPLAQSDHKALPAAMSAAVGRVIHEAVAEIVAK